MAVVPSDGVEYKVELGTTFHSPTQNIIYHTLQYHFKPASAANCCGTLIKAPEEGPLELEIAPGSSSEGPTVFKGNYQSYQKGKIECLLIFHPTHNTFTLERLTGSAKGLKHLRADHVPSLKPSASIPSSILPPPTSVRTLSNGSKGGSTKKRAHPEESDNNLSVKREKLESQPSRTDSLPQPHSEKHSSSEDETWSDLILNIEENNTNPDVHAQTSQKSNETGSVGDKEKSLFGSDSSSSSDSDSDSESESSSDSESDSQGKSNAQIS